MTLPLNDDLSNSETQKSLIQLDTYLKVICKALWEVPLGYIYNEVFTINMSSRTS